MRNEKRGREQAERDVMIRKEEAEREARKEEAAAEERKWQANDLICTTPRLCQNNMIPVALRGRGTTSTYNCFPATGLYFNLKCLLVSEETRPRPHVCSTGALQYVWRHSRQWGGGV